MKINTLLIVLFSISMINAQTINGVVKDSLSGEVIAYANIVLKNGKGTYSDEFGSFKLTVKNVDTDTLKVSTIGYESQFIPVNLFKDDLIYNVLLAPKTEGLDEVLISSKKLKYGKKEILGEQREGNQSVTSLIGYETAVLIENPENKTGKVNGVYINLKKRNDAEYIATFNVKFYQFDSIANAPGKLMYNENIYVQPKNKKYRLWVNVEDFGILFPKNGMCVGVEMVNTYGKVKKYAYFGPMYRYTFTEDKTLQTWSNYHNSGWRDGSIEYKNPKRTKVGVLNPMIGVEVEYILE
ncbi:carboxypeptidase-like regulatory domain-containing protein [Winogradskyella thalassocola]|uniref:CarboxypepD_reg-like domain-containing protein n=1 Tax=Winogradskyella thalassocola TaxID=262004 RepID=A0A1G7ZEB1_9FLAO|nr:carboxypeptidase-like regulatory domain-containing protein [Winogradskyella thalassocola]SDH07081.1 CarboxypepD_reg-like domain-containing protein [Winogradskyella thalassocola]